MNNYKAYNDKEFMYLCKKLLIIGSVYKYKELCSLFNESTKSSDSKKSQLKRWRRFFDWENPTTHTYKITTIYDEPKEIEDRRAGNGGSRKNSGAKPKVQEEFNYLFNAFLHREFNRNSYHGQFELCQSHFFSGEISRYFGMYSNKFYDARDYFSKMLVASNVAGGIIATKIEEFNHSWSDINKKIIEKRKSWIYNKIDKIDGVELMDGIIAYTNKSDNNFEYKDEYTNRWNLYMKEYVRSKKLRTIADVADMGMWDDMITYISGFFPDYERVEKTKKIIFDVHLLKDYELDEYEIYRGRFNEKLVTELIGYFKKRVSDDDMKMYKYVIEKYVKL